MRKNINKLATLVMTGALAASMSFSAFAVEGDSVNPSVSDESSEGTTTDTTSSKYDKTFAKEVTVDKDTTKAPKTVFNLDVTAGPSATSVKLNVPKADGSVEAKDYTVIPADAALAEKVKFDGADFKDVTTLNTRTEDDGTKTLYYTNNFKVNVEKDAFKAPGLYSFTVKEKNEHYTGVKYDDATYYMYASVINDGDTGKNFKIDTIVITKSTDASGAKIDTITNDFGKSNDGTHDLKLQKAVSGNAGNKNLGFKFEVSVNPKAGVNDNDLDNDGKNDIVAPTTQEFTLINGNDKTVISADGTKKEVTLKHDDFITIEGLTADYDVYITEVDAAKDSYVTTYEITNGTDASDNAVKSLKNTGLAATSTVMAEATADGTVVTFTNTRDNVTPTGVAMDIAPYALMVALAGGAAATFLRKKESFED